MRLYEEAERKYEQRCLQHRMKLYARILGSVLLASVTQMFWESNGAVGIEQAFLRANFQLRGPIPAPEDILLVAFDDALENLYPKPLPRGVDAEVLAKLTALNPKGLFLDIVYVPDDAEAEANKKIADALLRVPSIIGAGDMLTQRDAQRATRLGVEPIIAAAATWSMNMQFRALNGVIQGFSRNRSEQKSKDYAVENGAAEDYAVTVTNTVSTANAVPMVEALKVLTRRNVNPPFSDDLINYYGPPGTFPRLPVTKVLALPPSDLRKLVDGKLLFVGTQNISEKAGPKRNEEQFPVSYSDRLMYGIEVHATIAGNLLRAEMIRPLNRYAQALLLMTLVFVASFAQFTYPLKKAYGSLLGMIVAGELATYVLLTYARVWLAIVPPLLIFGVVNILFVAPFMKVISANLDKLIEKRMSLGPTDW